MRGRGAGGAPATWLAAAGVAAGDGAGQDEAERGDLGGEAGGAAAGVGRSGHEGIVPARGVRGKSWNGDTSRYDAGRGSPPGRLVSLHGGLLRGQGRSGLGVRAAAPGVLRLVP